MTLHVFNDPHGFYLESIIDQLQLAGPLNGHAFINLNNTAESKDTRVTYLPARLSAYKKHISDLSGVRSVHFYPLDHIASAYLLELLKYHDPETISWIFWSYELYHDPEIYYRFLDQYSLPWASRRKLLHCLYSTVRTFAKRVLGMPVYDPKVIRKARSFVTHFYSMLKEDFNNAHLPASVRWSRIGLYMIDDTARRTQPAVLTNEIMIGHAASVSSNHEAVIRKIAPYAGDRDIFIPLEYGDAGYREHIKEVAAEHFTGKLTLMQSRLTKQQYYHRLSVIGFAIFNFKYQEGLGNVMFLIWNGAKVFLSRESSAYKECKQWGVTVYSVEEDLSEDAVAALLSTDLREKNKEIVESYIGDKVVLEYFKPLSK